MEFKGVIYTAIGVCFHCGGRTHYKLYASRRITHCCRRCAYDVEFCRNPKWANVPKAINDNGYDGATDGSPVRQVERSGAEY